MSTATLIAENYQLPFNKHFPYLVFFMFSVLVHNMVYTLQ